MSNLALKPVFTDVGLAAIAAADGLGLSVKIAEVAIGTGSQDIVDDNDIPLASARAATALGTEKVRVTLTAGTALGPNQIQLRGSIPAAADEFWVTEVGYFDDAGTLICFWSSTTTNLGYRSSTVPWNFDFVWGWTDLPGGALTVLFTDDAIAQALADLGDHIADETPHPNAKYPYDIPFKEGWGTDGSGEDVVVGEIGNTLLVRDLDIDEIKAKLEVAPVGAALIYDIKIGGVSIFETLPKFVADGTVHTPGILTSDPDPLTAVAGAVVTVKITQVGTTTAGQKLLIGIKGRAQ